MIYSDKALNVNTGGKMDSCSIVFEVYLLNNVADCIEWRGGE